MEYEILLLAGRIKHGRHVLLHYTVAFFNTNRTLSAPTD